MSTRRNSDEAVDIEINVKEPSASEEQIRAKQDELREKITGNSRESEASNLMTRTSPKPN